MSWARTEVRSNVAKRAGQHLVARVVAEAVVHLFEVVEVAQQHRHRLALGVRHQSRLGQCLAGPPSVADTGELIGVGLGGQPDVLLDPFETDHQCLDDVVEPHEVIPVGQLAYSTVNPISSCPSTTKWRSS